MKRHFEGARNARNVRAYQRQGCDISRNRSGSPPPPTMVSLESSPARRPAVGNDERERDHHYRVVAGLRSIFTNSAQPNPPINAPNGVRNNHGIGLPQHRFSRIAYRLAEFVAGAVFLSTLSQRPTDMRCKARRQSFPLIIGGEGIQPKVNSMRMNQSATVTKHF